MGTDSTGRDIFARIIYGGQISLLVGFLAVIVAALVGVLIGAFSGYYGGVVDSVLMRFTEAMLAIPTLLILIVLSKALLGRIPNLTFLDRSISGSVPIVILVIGVTSWMYGARIVRAQFLSIREQEYVTAAHALGVKNDRIIWRHILPNTMGPIIVFAALGLVNAITLEAYVSFLGLGVQEPTASWGNIINQALSFIQRGVWWLWFFPSLMIILTLLCVNFLGDGLRDALDPRNLVES
ncbi:MAG: ABC transporter permease [Chloroflexi bacterium]|nr:ABC transporter permease [Chloroflexota bacterium]